MSNALQLKKGVSSWHKQLADWLLANPGATNGECAKHFGKTAAWISSIKHSDAFQDYYHELQKAHSEALLAGVRERMLGTTDLAVEELQRRISADPTAIPYGQLLETVDVLAKRAVPETKQQVNVNLSSTVTKDELAELRGRMRERTSKPALGGPVVDAEAIEVKDP